MRRKTYIEMEYYPRPPSLVERVALWLLIAFSIFGSGAAVALAWGWITYPAHWPL